MANSFTYSKRVCYIERINENGLVISFFMIKGGRRKVGVSEFFLGSMISS